MSTRMLPRSSRLGPARAFQVATKTIGKGLTKPGVSNEARAVLKAAVAADLRSKGGAGVVAERIRPLLQPTRPAAKAIANYRAELEAQGLPPKVVARRVQQYTERKVRERSQVVASTEVSRARRARDRAEWEAQADGSQLEWLATMARVRKTKAGKPVKGACCRRCAQMNGQRVGRGQQFKTPEGGRCPHPPLHPGCHCQTVRVQQ